MDDTKMTDIATTAAATTTPTITNMEEDGPKSKRELPEGAVATLRAWLLSPEHITHPYPTPQDQALLMQKTGIDKKQLKNWFTNARRRIWKPLLKKQLEQGQLQLPTMGAAGGGVGLAAIQHGGAGPGGDAAAAAALAAAWAKSPQPPVAPATNTGQPMGGEPPRDMAAVDGHAHVMMQQQQPTLQPTLHDVYSAGHQQQFGRWPQGQGQGQQYGQWPGMAPFNSMGGSLPPIAPSNVTDSHAVLMELFARDQELVRQAAEGVRALAAAQAAMGTQELMRQAMDGIKALQQVQQAQAIAAMGGTTGSGIAPGGGAIGDGQDDKAQVAQLHIAANAAFEAIERVDAERAATTAAAAAAGTGSI